MFKKSKEGIVLIILSFGIIVSIFYAVIFWKNYEKYSSNVKFGTGIYENDENAEYLKGKYNGSKILNGKDVFLYFITAEEILNLLKEKNFFFSQPEFKISFLHPNIIAFFSYMANDNVIESHKNEKKLIIGKKKFLIYLQIFIYYISLFFLFKSIKNIIEVRTSLFLIAFLSIEPTIMQWNISFMTESFFFSFLIFFLSFLLKEKKIFYFFSGIFFGLMILQRFFIFYYFIFIFIYFFIKSKKILSKQIVFFFIGSFLVLFILIISNYLRAKTFYISPMQAKLHFAHYFEHKLLSKEKKITLLESVDILRKRNEDWKNKNLLINSEINRLSYYNFRHLEALKTIMRNKYDFSIVILRSSLNVVLINPTQMWFKYSKYENRTAFKATNDFKISLFIRFFYSLFIYIICLIGIVNFFVKKNFSLVFLFLSFILYSLAISSLGMNERYFVPSLIFLSLFFSIGLEKILTKYKFLK
jgi:hypothetical protein